MQQANDFLEESETLAKLIASEADDRWDEPTQFKNWTTNDVLVHLHFWNKTADLSLTDEAAFKIQIAQLMDSIKAGGLRAYENAAIPQRGKELLELWQDTYRDMAARWAGVDPKRRLGWVGPTMSARSSITARQMETWSHGFEIFDLFGVERKDSDRVKNIVVLGVNTFGFSYKIRGEDAPDAMPRLTLSAPSGEIWAFGEGPDEITGPATDFAAVVTQTRSFHDTSLKANGLVAREWMENAQCFAGPPNRPPAKGSRFRAGR